MALTAFDSVDTPFDDPDTPFDGKEEEEVSGPAVAALVDPGTLARRLKKRKHDIEAFVAWWRLRRYGRKP